MNRIRELRKAHGLTMKELGKQIGLAESTVSLYERNLHEPDLDTLRSLSAIFSVSVDYLLGYDDVVVSKTETAPANSIDAQIIKELKGEDEELAREVLDYIKFKKQNRQGDKK